MPAPGVEGMVDAVLQQVRHSARVDVRKPEHRHEHEQEHEHEHEHEQEHQGCHQILDLPPFEQKCSKNVQFYVIWGKIFHFYHIFGCF